MGHGIGICYSKRLLESWSPIDGHGALPYFSRICALGKGDLVIAHGSIGDINGGLEFSIAMSLWHPYTANMFAIIHCKFFHGIFYRFCLCNKSHYSPIMILIDFDDKFDCFKIFKSYKLIPWKL